MAIFIISIIFGLIILTWSAGKFVDGASTVARSLRISPLVIGMVIIGFGTSAPELVVSLISSYEGKSALAIGNAFGSNIVNIGLVLGLVSLYTPILVESQVLKKELPILCVVTLVIAFLLVDLRVSRLESFLLLGLFIILTFWMIKVGRQSQKDTLTVNLNEHLTFLDNSLKKSYLNLIIGFIILIASSRLLVYGAVGLAEAFGVSELIIGLTIVAIGTSLPELASSIIAARKGESDLALGNVLGSNLFNTLAVVGVSGVVRPIEVDSNILHRDLSFMGLLTLSIFALGFGFKRPGRINRVEGGLLLLSYVFYLIYLTMLK